MSSIHTSRTPFPAGSDLIIDVGANQGDFVIDAASRNPQLLVLAIEPITALCDRLQVKLHDAGVSNVLIENVAIDTDERTATFHVANHHDLGISSLLPLREGDIAKDDYWKNREDLYFDQEIIVKVVPLAGILARLQPRSVRFIKIDAQGLDINVLDSLGPYLDITECGMLEVPATARTALYEGEVHHLGTALAHLTAKGFETYAIKPNDHAANEYNVFFCRKGLDPAANEESLQLRGIPLYDGKHYWHQPSNRWEDLPPPSVQPEGASQGQEQAQGRREGTPGPSDLIDLIQEGRNIFWGGRYPPLHWITASEQIFDSSKDYRLPGTHHQQFDVVYLVERDLASMKAWPQVMDEALRLLKPQGLLALRTTNSPLLSIFELMSFIHSWGTFDICHEATDVQGVLQIVIRNRARACRPTAIEGLSFGVITNGQRPEYLKALFDSIKALDNPSQIPIEILVCSPDKVRDQLLQSGYDITHVPDPAGFDSLGWITKKKNLLVSKATQRHVVIAHDRYWFPADFLQKLIEFGGDFSALTCRQTLPDGRRFPDWVTMGSEWSWTSPAVLAYGDWSRHIYINGGLIIANTDVLRSTPWNEMLFWNQAEDVELTRRLMRAGHVPRLARHVEAVTQTMREGFMSGFHSVPTTFSQHMLPDPIGSSATRPIPRADTVFFAPFGLKYHDLLRTLGVYTGETWRQERKSVLLPRGCWGEITFHPTSKRSFTRLLTLKLKAPLQTVKVLVNDKEIPDAHQPGASSIRIRLEPGMRKFGKVCRIHVHSETSDVRIKSMSLSLPGTRLLSATKAYSGALLQRLADRIRRKIRKNRNK